MIAFLNPGFMKTYIIGFRDELTYPEFIRVIKWYKLSNIYLILPIHVIHSIAEGCSKKKLAVVSHVGRSMNITANGIQQIAKLPTIIAIMIVILEIV